tara:strand:+ start:216 stop:380 length:165 start_codon:yes stop_codon:yes gene_type:complete
MCGSIHRDTRTRIYLLMIFLSTILNSLPPGSRDLVEFGFFMAVGITAGSAGLLS